MATVKNSLLEKIRKNSSIKETEILTKSKFFTKKDMIKTSIPAINIALSGEVDGGFIPGLTLWAGPSKHGKTFFSLLMAKAYMDKYPEAVLILLDCEFGSPLQYFTSIGIDTDRVVHIPIMNMEEFKFEVLQQLTNFERGDKVILMVDSLGNMASKKEVDDAVDGKSTQDMTRARQMKSIFRMITPYLTRLDIPMVAVAHIYMSQETFSKPVVSGGTGIYLSADTIFIIGRQQEKDGTELMGWNFIINVEKSRHVKEKSKIPITVKFESGMSKWSGLLDIALEAGAVIRPSQGWYSRVNQETGEVEDKKYRAKDTDNKEFWMPILLSERFREWVKNHYKVGMGKLVSDETEDIPKASEVIIDDETEYPDEE